LDIAQQQPAVEGGFVVELDRFQGPLDLLLHLIREQDIDIFDIPISQITSQFLLAIQGVEQLGLDRAGEFLELAATLVRIKAQMLLPRRADATGEDEDPRAELVRRLLEYEHFREVAHRLDDAEAERRRHFSRGFIPPRSRPEPVYLPLELEWDDMWSAVLSIGERARIPAEHRVVARAVPLTEKLALITETLDRLTRVEFRALCMPYADKLHTVVTFMAGLELARLRVIQMRQREPFTELWLYRRNGQTHDAEDTDR
jgi:segregation and condensation protein A